MMAAMSLAISTREWMPSATRACEEARMPTLSLAPASTTLTAKLSATVRPPSRCSVVLIWVNEP